MGAYLPYAMAYPPGQWKVRALEVEGPLPSALAQAIPPPVRVMSASVASPTVAVVRLILIVPAPVAWSLLRSLHTLLGECEATTTAPMKIR
jgi:hypothetical protein